MIALLQGLQNVLVRLHHLWSFSQHKYSSRNFNTSFQGLIILEEFYYITKKLDCYWLYELRDCCASCCSKSATRAPSSAISFVSNQPCGFSNTPCVLPNTPHDFSPNPPSNFSIQPRGFEIRHACFQIHQATFQIRCGFVNPPCVFLYSLKFIEEHLSWEKEHCGGHVVIIVYSSYVCNTPIVREKILQLIW